MSDSLTKLNKTLDHNMWILSPVGVAIGVILGSRISSLTFLGIYVFSLMTFTGSSSMRLSDFTRVLKHPLPVLVFILNVHVLIPIIGITGAKLVFPNEDVVVMGYVLLLSGPIAVISYMWTSIYRGDGPLSLTLVMVDSLLSPLIMPLSAAIFGSSGIHIDTTPIMTSLLWMVVIPLVVGVAINEFSKGEIGVKTKPVFKLIGKIFLVTALILNTSKISDEIRSLTIADIKIVVYCFALSLIGYLVGFSVSKLCRFPKEQCVAFTFASGLRNTTASLIVAVSFFPKATAIPVITTILFQQILCALSGKFLLRSHQD